MKKILPLVLIAAVVGVVYYVYYRTSPVLVLTGIVTTHEVIVSPQVAGQVSQLLVTEGDQVKKDQLLVVIMPDELKADSAYYASSAAGVGAQVQASEAALRYQELQTTDQIRQAESTLASLQAQVAAARATLDNAKLVFSRTDNLSRQGVVATQDLDTARTARDAAEAQVSALNKQVEAQTAAVALARSNAQQTAMRRSQLLTTQRQQDAANAQRVKADVRLGYTEIKAPIDGYVDTRTVRGGEVVNAGQPLLTLVNPDDLWVRADVEETYVDRVAPGTKLTVRFPFGEERQGTVFYRGADAAFATQRDVSRTKRDIRTFEVRLRVDNSDRKLALGMTAYVSLPVQ